MLNTHKQMIERLKPLPIAIFQTEIQTFCRKKPLRVKMENQSTPERRREMYKKLGPKWKDQYRKVSASTEIILGS